MNTRPISWFPVALLLAFANAGISLAAVEETPWKKAEHVETRLVASHKAVPPEGDGALYLGWYVRLAEGWKTYWRSPGNAGQPPRITWDGSVNIASAELLFPLPERFEIFGLFTYGYHDEVVYPIRITPRIEGAPVTARATIHFLVCDVLCVPHKETYELVIPAATGLAPLSLNAGLIETYLQRVPDKAGEEAAIAIEEIALFGEGDSRTLRIRIKGEKLLSGADVIVEDREGLTFGKPRKRLLGDSTVAEFVVPVYAEDPATAGKEAEVTLIVSDGWGRAEESEITLDFN